MALTGYGLQPGGWEKNLKRSTQGGYGAINRQPASDALANMTREKYAAGLKAKQDKDRFDFAKQREETRHGEWGEEFGFRKSEADRAADQWAQELGLSRDELDAMTDYRLGQLGLSRDQLGLSKEQQEFSQNQALLAALLNLGLGESGSAAKALQAMGGTMGGLAPQPKLLPWQKRGGGYNTI